MNFSNKEEKIQIILELRKRKQEKEKQKCQRNKFYWLTHYVYTLDPHDKENPIKLFPDYRYIQELIRLDEKEDIILLEKSRQMMVTWLEIALCVHEIQFNQGRHVFIQSKKEDDANTLVDRAKFIYNRQPDWLKPEPNPGDTFLKLKIKSNNSLIKGIPEGGDQIRTHTASRIFSDEVASQPEFESAYTASLPCVKGGGKFIGVSTAKPTFFYELTGEKAEKTQIITGLWEKHTPRGNCIITLHYTADPRKRTLEWREKEKLGFKTQEGGTDARWEQEYEINYEAVGGTLVYSELEKEFSYIFIEPFEIPKWWNKYGSIDPGTRVPTSVHFYAIDEYGRVFVYWELYEKELHYLQLCRTLESHEDFKEINKRGFMIDPESAKMVHQTKFGIKSFKDILEGEGVNLFAGNRDRMLGAERIREFIRENKLFIFKTCPKMWGELIKLRYEEWKGAGKMEKDVKQAIIAKNDHAWSDLRYFLLSNFIKSKKPLSELEAKIRKLKKQKSNDFNRLYSVNEEDSYGGTKPTIKQINL